MTTLKKIGVPLDIITLLLYFIKTPPKTNDSLIIPEPIHNSPPLFFASVIDKLRHPSEPYFNNSKFIDKGLPMGMAFSPLLATLVLQVVVERTKLKHPESRFYLYADDGLISCDGPLEKLKEMIITFKQELLKHSIQINESKSKMIKENGVWLHVLKFCGLIYDP